MKSTIKRLFRSLGLEISRYNPAQSESAQIMKMLTVHDVNMVIDVGANVGQFGIFLREAGYKNRIVSFEPLLYERNQLIKASTNDPLWDVATRAAIGNVNDEIDINISSNSQSSSVLNMLETHTSAAPDSTYIGVERVPLRTLDSLALDYIDSHTISFLKIDTQGYEDRVLEGANKTLDKIAGLQLELSLVPLYQDQRLYDELIGKLKSLGFNLWAITPVFIDQSSGRLLQFDATFFRD
jgi:FkbM family methyltransferase